LCAFLPANQKPDRLSPTPNFWAASSERLFLSDSKYSHTLRASHQRSCCLWPWGASFPHK